MSTSPNIRHDDLVAVRDRLIDAGMSGRIELVRAACERDQATAAACPDELAQLPSELVGDHVPRELVDEYIRALSAVAYCLASEFETPGLYERLSRPPSDIDAWEAWLAAFEDRLGDDALALCAEARAFIRDAAQLTGEPARHYEGELHRRLAQAQYRAGAFADAVASTETALSLFERIDDLTGQVICLSQAIELHLAAGHPERALEAARRLRALCQTNGLDTDAIDERVHQVEAVIKWVT